MGHPVTARPLPPGHVRAHTGNTPAEHMPPPATGQASAFPRPGNQDERPVPSLANWTETCDWGHCSGQSHGVRWADDLGQWLSVCRKHRASDVVTFEELPEMDLTDGVMDRAAAAADQPGADGETER